MAQYTITLKTLIDNGFDIGLKDYPIFDENYRKQLNDKIINHFYFREISAETETQFRFFINRKMAEIMPYYNKLYESEKLKIEPFNNINVSIEKSVDISSTNNGKTNLSQTNTGNTTTDSESQSENTNTSKITNDSTGNSTATKENNAKFVESTTPQGLLTINSIEGELYASSAHISKDNENITTTDKKESTNEATTTDNTNNNSIINSESTAQTEGETLSENTANQTETINEITSGKNSAESYSYLLTQYRETFLNIDMQIIEELKSLFIMIF